MRFLLLIFNIQNLRVETGEKRPFKYFKVDTVLIIRTINIQVCPFVSTSYLYKLSHDYVFILIYKCTLIPILPQYIFVKINILQYIL